MVHGREAVGVVAGDHVTDVASLAGASSEIIEILAAGRERVLELEDAVSRDGSGGVPLADVRLLAPIPRPPKFLGVGFNSADHEAEIDRARESPAMAALRRRRALLAEAFPAPRFATIFNKQTSCVTGPCDEVWLPHDSDRLDYEGEIAVVIGRRLRRANAQAAAEAIAGYLVTNDVSVRDWQTNTSQMWLGKSFETHGPIGPWVVTADEFDLTAARIRTWVNGELRQHGALAEQHLSPSEIVSQVSQVCTLDPGDLIATGTPGGIGSLQGRFLTVGDRIRVSVDGIGTIENTIVAEPLRA